MRSISCYLGLPAVSKAHNPVFRKSKAKFIFPLPPSLPDTALELDFRTVFIAEAFYLFIFQDQLHTEGGGATAGFESNLPSLRNVSKRSYRVPHSTAHLSSNCSSSIHTHPKQDRFQDAQLCAQCDVWCCVSLWNSCSLLQKSSPGTCYGNHWAAVLGEGCTTANTGSCFLAILGLNCSSFLLSHQHAHWSHCLKSREGTERVRNLLIDLLVKQ